jgi:hypothetical protein
MVGANAWRPAFIDGATSASAPVLYQRMRPIFRLLAGSRRFYVRGEDIGRAMLVASRRGLRGRTFENREIRALADEYEPEEAVSGGPTGGGSERPTAKPDAVAGGSRFLPPRGH